MVFKKEDAITDILKLIAPGTAIREGLENILKAKTGALIVIGDSKEVLELVDGGISDFFDKRMSESGDQISNHILYMLDFFHIIFTLKYFYRF